MKKMRVSPDGLIQFALQMAYFSITKTFPLTYEAAITTLFNNGRTETIRTNSASISATVKEISQLDKDKIDEKQKRDIRKAIIECIEGIDNATQVQLYQSVTCLPDGHLARIPHGAVLRRPWARRTPL